MVWKQAIKYLNTFISITHSKNIIDGIDFGKIVQWNKNMQYVLRTEQFKELYEKSEFSDYYFEDLFGMEPDYEWRIH